MPWKCPACETEVQHEGVAPVPGRLYRCHVCRLELIHDTRTNKMQVAPLPDAAADKPKRDRDPRR
jgi:hypothetical protein